MRTNYVTFLTSVLAAVVVSCSTVHLAPPTQEEMNTADYGRAPTQEDITVGIRVMVEYENYQHRSPYYRLLESGDYQVNKIAQGWIGTSGWVWSEQKKVSADHHLFGYYGTVFFPATGEEMHMLFRDGKIVCYLLTPRTSWTEIPPEAYTIQLRR